MFNFDYIIKEDIKEHNKFLNIHTDHQYLEVLVWKNNCIA